MASRLGKNQIAMLQWLSRHGGERVFVGDATPAAHELSGWEIGDAVRAIRSLRNRGLVFAAPNCRGFISLSAEGRAMIAASQGQEGGHARD